jgi:hypothetical protein
MQNDVVYLNFLYFFSIFILQKYMVRSKFATLYICRPKYMATAAVVLPPRGTAAWVVAHWQGHIRSGPWH